jgi:arsenate reductase (thioredoxin)
MATPPSDRPTSRHCRNIEDCRISDVDLLLNHAAADLTRRFDGSFAYETVRRCIGEFYDLLAVNARIHAHLPLLAARFARERLQAAAKIPGATVSTTGEDLAGH